MIIFNPKSHFQPQTTPHSQKQSGRCSEPAARRSPCCSQLQQQELSLLEKVTFPIWHLSSTQRCLSCNSSLKACAARKENSALCPQTGQKGGKIHWQKTAKLDMTSLHHVLLKGICPSRTVLNRAAASGREYFLRREQDAIFVTKNSTRMLFIYFGLS